MSNKLPMVAIDKVEVKFSMRAETVVRVDKIKDTLGLESRSAVINALVEDDVKDVPFDDNDRKRLDEILDHNAKRRAMLARKKGIKSWKKPSACRHRAS